jgi:HPt (histidine-containing phosphotransfer) domain-containing protein
LNTNLADPDRRPAWQSWRKEVFADLYACQTAGPAYVWALADQLAREHAQIAKENRPLQNGEWTNYPTKALRVHFCCKALELSGFVSEGQELQQQWTQSYPEHLLLKFLEDAEEVIKRLTDVLNLADIPTAIFTREMMNGASALARRCRAGALLAKDEPRSARVYVTAAWLIAGPNEGSAELSRHWNTLAQHHLVSRPAGLAGNAPSPASDAAETTQAAIDRIAAILFVDL